MSKNENKAGKPKNTKPCNRVIARFVGGGDKEDRTPDLLTASQTLSQLSYAPLNFHSIIIAYSRLLFQASNIIC